MHVLLRRCTSKLSSTFRCRSAYLRVHVALGRHAATTAERRRPELPPHLQTIVDEYDRQEAEAAKWSVLHPRLAGPLGMGLAGIIAYLLYSFDDVSSDAPFGKFLSMLDVSTARSIVLRLASWDMLPKDYDKDDPYLVIEPDGSGLRFMTPVGLGAGFDRDGVGSTAFFNMGFGFVDIGPVSNTEGIRKIQERLKHRDLTGQVAHFGVLGIVLSGESAAELKTLASELGTYTDYIAINLSGGRWKDPDALQKLVADVIATVAGLPGGGPKVFVRIPPSWPEVSASASLRSEACANAGSAALAGGATGLILCHMDNDADANDSDDPSADSDNLVIGEVYQRTGGRLAIVACGGITSGREAMSRIEAGATVVQISNLVVTEGPYACRRIKNELSLLLMNDGYIQLKDAVGCTHRKQRRVNRKKPSFSNA